MALRQHGPRKLSNLEKAALDLVFKAYPIPRGNKKKKTIFDDLRISHLPISKSLDRGSYSGRHIKIGIETHRCADDLGYCSALGNTDILKPGNMDYLNTFIHEATHLWQSSNDRYHWSGPSKPRTLYSFTQEELTESPPVKHKLEDENPFYNNPNPKEKDILNLWREQHASAVATWFVIAWQLKYTRVGETEEIDLTTGRPGHSVGTVNRYVEIEEKTLNARGRWVPRDEAQMLAMDFENVWTELHNSKIFVEGRR